MSQPRGSLARRLSGAVLVVGLVMMSLQFGLMQLWLEPMRRELDASLLLQLRLVDEALRSTPSEEREALARRLGNSRLRLQRMHHWPEPEPLPRRLRELRSELLAELPLGSELRLPPQEDQGPAHLEVLWRLGGNGEGWRASFFFDRPLDSLSYTLGGGLLLVGLLASAALLMTVRVIARPLQGLAAQIAAQGEQLQPLLLEPRASREVEALVEAFNQLARQVQLSQRQRQQLLAGVSHDLRTPLARLRLRIETQLEGPVAEQLEHDLLALQHIAEQFLAFVQGEAAPQPGPRRPLRPLLNELLQSYPEVELDDQLPPQAGELAIPETALRRLLVNLMDNALAHGAEPVRLGLELQHGQLLLRVSDEGAGLSETAFVQALQPFVRLSADNGDGHCGLGLAIAAQMARQLQGRLRVRPRDGELPFAVELLIPLGEPQ